MTGEEIQACVERAYPGRLAYQSYMLARWAAFPDPAELPPGWTLSGDPITTETGIRQYASPPRGGLYVDVPRRLRAWTCPAGVEHWRYWRSGHHPNHPALVACEHTPDPIALVGA